MKWFAACGGLQLGMAQIVGCLDRLQSAFWSCRGQTLVSPPVLASLPAPTPLNKLDWRLGQYFLPVWRNTHENCRKTFLSFLKSIYSIKFEEVWVWKCVCLCMHVCVGGSGGVWSQTGQSQQEGLDLDMVVKFHWLKVGLLHWLLSVELIIHMVGGEEWWGNPPQQKKKREKSKDMATREQVMKQQFFSIRSHLCYNPWVMKETLISSTRRVLRIISIHLWSLFTDGLISRVLSVNTGFYSLEGLL